MGSSGVKSHRKICAQIRKANEKVEEEAEKIKFRRSNGKQRRIKVWMFIVKLYYKHIEWKLHTTVYILTTQYIVHTIVMNI